MNAPIIGMDLHSGGPLDAVAHIRQCVADILTTPRGSMPWRRDYGCDLYALIDRPYNSALIALMRAATATALTRWEPRLRLKRVGLDRDTATGAVTVLIEATRHDTAQPFTTSLTLE